MLNIVGSSRYQINRKSLKSYFVYLFDKYNVDPAGVINLVFMGKRKMKAIALSYKKEDVALPVLAFPYNEQASNERLLGEIFICYPQAVLLAAHRNKKVEDVLKQLTEHGLKNIIA